MGASITESFLNEVKKINKEANFLELSEYGEIKSYISTGSYLLNASVTSNIFKGIPAGRAISLEGEPGVGKTFIAGKIASEAQKDKYIVIWFDSENATDKFFLQRLGVDISKCIYIPIVTVEEFRNQSGKILEMLEKKQKESIKAGEAPIKMLIVLDSLGNCSTNKEMADLAAGKDAQDMGLKAKIIKSMTRTLTGFLARTFTPLIIINHGQWSREPNPNIPSKFVPTGGLGVIYLSSIRILITKYIVKEIEGGDIEGDDGKAKKVQTGNILGTEIRKNRFIPEGKKARIKVDFKTGINPYHGLIEEALKYNIFEYVKKFDKKGNFEGYGTKIAVPYLSKNFSKPEFEEIEIAKEIWTDDILNQLNIVISKDNQYSSVTDAILGENEPTEEEVKLSEELEKDEKKERKHKKKEETVPEEK